MIGPDPAPDAYRLLGVKPDASPDEIRAAFRTAVRREHPDTTPLSGDGTTVRDVIAAYHLLNDPVRRARYDARRRSGAGRSVTVRNGPTSRPDPTEEASPTRCRRCGGRGIVRSVSLCPACAGSAVITVLDGRRSGVVRCRRCGGVGRIGTVEACGSCRGTGLV